jgi:hypothetical protein
MDKPIRFEYTAPIGATPTRVPFPEDLTEAGAAKLQIRNTGAAALTAMTLKSKAHPDAIAVNVITTSEQWVSGSLIADISGNPFALAAGATADLVINCKAQVELIFEATCGTSTDLTVLGYLFPDGGAV